MGLLALVAGLALIAVLALGAGLLLAAVNVLYRDVENVVDLVVMVLVWASPVLYPWQLVADLVGDSWLLTAYQLNPLTVAVELVHRRHLGHGVPAEPRGHPARAGVAHRRRLRGRRSPGRRRPTRVFRAHSGRFAQEL